MCARVVFLLLLIPVLAACPAPRITPEPARPLPEIAQVAASPAAPASPSPSGVPAASPTATWTATTAPSPTIVPTFTIAPSPTTAPTATSSPQPTAAAPTATLTRAATAAPPAPVAKTSYRITEITLPTYPFAAFQGSAIDAERNNYPVPVLDRGAYDASNPQPVPQTYRLLVLENRYLRLGILPDLGGRIYECTFKPTGNNEFYHNPVIKPTGWGPPSPPYPSGANWWLAAGGLEFGFPVEEHGYEWSTSWGFDHAIQANGGVMVSLFTRRGPRNPYAVVDVILPPDTAYFVMQPRIINPTGAAFRFKWWANAMLAPGAANQPGPDLRFIFPVSQVTVHSTGDPALPGAGQPMSWPFAGGRDMSRLGNWAQWLGVFQRPAAQGNFMGVYDAAANEGLVRIYPSDVARGAKLFAMGWSAAIPASTWTDDGSGYVELHGGLAPTFDDWYELPPGGEVTWSEAWYPVAGIGGVTFANDDAALALLPAGEQLRVGLFPTAALQGRLTITLSGADVYSRDVVLNPARPLVDVFTLPASASSQGAVGVTLINAQGRVLFEWQGTLE